MYHYLYTLFEGKKKPQKMHEKHMKHGKEKKFSFFFAQKRHEKLGVKVACKLESHIQYL